MNLKLLTLGTVVAFSAAMAQTEQPVAETPAEATPVEQTQSTEPAAEPAPAAETPVAEAPVQEQSAEVAPVVATETEPVAEATPTTEVQTVEQPPVTEDKTSNDRFNVLHGNAYNATGNESGSATVSSNMSVPLRMFGSKMFYVEPTLQTGVVAFGSESSTYFLGFDNSQDLGLLTAGLATKGFGVSVSASLGKTFTSIDNDNDEKTSTTKAGDVIAANAGFDLGAFELGVKVGWTTIDVENNEENNSGEYDEDFFDITANVNLSNSPSGKNWFWSLGLDFVRHNLTKTTSPKKGSETTVTDPNSNITISPYFNIGGTILSVANARVLIGLNTDIPVIIYDDIKGERDGSMEFGINTTPNILGELALTDNWIIHAGAAHTWTLFNFAMETEIDGRSETDISEATFNTSKTIVDTGIRFQYNNYALEATIAKEFYNNPLCGFNGKAMIASLGAFIFF